MMVGTIKTVLLMVFFLGRGDVAVPFDVAAFPTVEQCEKAAPVLVEALRSESGSVDWFTVACVDTRLERLLPSA